MLLVYFILLLKVLIHFRLDLWTLVLTKDLMEILYFFWPQPSIFFFFIIIQIYFQILFPFSSTLNSGSEWTHTAVLLSMNLQNHAVPRLSVSHSFSRCLIYSVFCEESSQAGLHRKELRGWIIFMRLGVLTERCTVCIGCGFGGGIWAIDFFLNTIMAVKKN